MKLDFVEFDKLFDSIHKPAQVSFDEVESSKDAELLEETDDFCLPFPTNKKLKTSKQK